MVKGLKKTYKAVMSANGPAQMLTYSFWGVLMAGMLTGVEPALLFLWGFLSLLVAPVTVWCSKTWLRSLLLLDTLVSAWILATLLMVEPQMSHTVYYSMSANGMNTRTVDHGGHSVSEWFHIASVIWMTLNGIYLADLTNRQLLETRRFER